MDIHACIHARMHTHSLIHTQTHTHARSHMHTHTHAYTHTYTHTHTRIHTHANFLDKSNVSNQAYQPVRAWLNNSAVRLCFIRDVYYLNFHV